MAKGEFLASDGTRLAYRDDGPRGGRVLLALAGLTRDGRDFDYLARKLPRELRLLRLDSRGRGDSAWADPETYTVGQEAQDALALLDHLAVPRAAIIGSSRGGLLAMVLAATAKPRVAGICFNDVGPELEKAGLLRIGTYMGVRPDVTTLQEVADRLPAANPRFCGVPVQRWADEAIRHYIQGRDGLELPYDPALRIGFDRAMAGPLPPIWNLFDACADLPLALIRGANSDVLTRETADEMRLRRPDMLWTEVQGRGHIPFLDEPEALHLVRQWLAL